MLFQTGIKSHPRWPLTFWMLFCPCFLPISLNISPQFSCLDLLFLYVPLKYFFSRVLALAWFILAFHILHLFILIYILSSTPTVIITNNMPTDPLLAYKTALVPIRKWCHFLADGFQIAIPAFSIKSLLFLQADAVPSRVENVLVKLMADIYYLSTRHFQGKYSFFSLPCLVHTFQSLPCLFSIWKYLPLLPQNVLCQL